MFLWRTRNVSTVYWQYQLTNGEWHIIQVKKAKLFLIFHLHNRRGGCWGVHIVSCFLSRGCHHDFESVSTIMRPNVNGGGTQKGQRQALRFSLMILTRGRRNGMCSHHLNCNSLVERNGSRLRKMGKSRLIILFIARRHLFSHSHSDALSLCEAFWKMTPFRKKTERDRKSRNMSSSSAAGGGGST